MGIVAYSEGLDSDRKSKTFIITSFGLALISCILYVYCECIPVYYIFYLVAPLIFYATCFLLKRMKLSHALQSFFCFCGNNSLEIYVGNVIAMTLCAFFEIDNIFYNSFLVLGLTVVSSIVCIKYNSLVQKLLR